MTSIALQSERTVDRFNKKKRQMQARKNEDMNNDTVLNRILDIVGEKI